MFELTRDEKIKEILDIIRVKVEHRSTTYEMLSHLSDNMVDQVYSDALMMKSYFVDIKET